MVYLMLRLKKLEVKNCRGIRDGPNLTIGPGGLLLCGDNGTGKSSYVDAIEKLLTGKCSSIDGIQGISWKNHGPHLGHQNNQKITLTITDGNKEYLVDYSQEPQRPPKNLINFLKSAKAYPFILRRKTLLEFIDARPQERYGVIEGFLKLAEFTQFEEQIKELQTYCQEKIADVKDRKTDNIRSLRSRLEIPQHCAVDVDICIQKANQFLLAVGIPPLETLSDISDRLGKLEENISPLKQDENLQKWTALQTNLNDVHNNEEVNEAGRIYFGCRQDLLSEEKSLKGHFYVEVLENGLEWIQEDALNRCPLCNNTIDIYETSQYIRQRIEENAEIITLKDTQERQRVNFETLIKSNLESFKKIQTQSMELFGPGQLEKLDLLIQLYHKIFKGHQQLADPATIIADISELSEQNPDDFIQELAEILETKRSGFTENERYQQLFNTKTVLTALALHVRQIDRCDLELRHFSTSSIQMELLVNYSVHARKAAVQKLMNAIADIADGYYQKIHPGETIGKPRLIITDRGTGSIRLTGTFYDKDDDPRGHYSEGHLDTLGLCLFLAICRAYHQQYPDFSLLILDDVLHSVDGNHRIKTADLIFEEFRDHQIIITTHDRMWFETLKKKARSNSGGKNFTEYQISYWTLEEGPVFGDHLSEYDWLISELGLKGQPADRVMKAGRLLEEILQNLCDSLSISVPFRIRGDYTIDPLWSSFYHNVKKSHKGFYEPAKYCLDSIEKLRSQRNLVGAHYNESAKALTRAESEEFVQSVIGLRDLVYCCECHQFIKRIPQLDGVWSCKREHLRYNEKKTLVNPNLTD